jgi:hypothetical protein
MRASAVKRDSGAGARPGLRSFVLAACALVALFFIDAASGRVLSQADILLRFSPWVESGPAGAVASNGRRPGNPMLGDIPTFVVPSLAFTRTSLLEGRFPVWNPGMYGGQPFLASYQTGLLSPFVMLSVLLPPADALLAHAVARLLIGAIGMFVFLRGLGLVAPAVWFGALAFLFNPFTVVWLEHPPSAVACWLPWLLWSVDRNRQDGGLGHVAGLAALTALTLLAGHPETAFKVFLVTGAYAICVCLAGTDRGRLASDCRLLVGRMLPAVLLGAAVAAAQIVPFVEYMGESGIAAMRRSFAVSPMVVPAREAVTAFVPDVFGNPARGASLTNYLEQAAYPGNVAWILAAVAVAVAARRHWRVTFLAGTAIVSAALMYGAPGVSQLFAVIPLAGLSAPSRFGLVTIFAVMALGAIGLHAIATADRMREPAERGRVLRAAVVGLAIMAVVVASLIAWQWSVFRDASFVREMALAVLWSGGVAGVAAGIVVCWARGVATVRMAFALLTIVSVGDAFALGFRFHPMIPRAEVFPRLPAIETIAADRTLFRVAGFGDSLVPNAAMAYGLADARGYDGVAPRRYTDLLGRAFGPGLSHRIDARGALPVVDLLNVKYLVADGAREAPVAHWIPIPMGPVTVYRNTRVFPRAWLVDRAAIRDEASTLAWIVDPASDLRREAPIAEALDADAGPEPAASGGVGDVVVSRYEPTDVELTTRASGRRLLVLADAWYPGWAVYVDGRKAGLVRAYHALRAVPVPGGRHVVRFVYEPASVRIGAAVSAAALIVLAGLVVVAYRRR